MEITKDIIYQVYAGKKSRKIIDLILATFIPDYEKLNPDYACKPNDQNYIFKTEDEMVNYFIGNTGISQTFYWNKYQDNPYHIMVGANITDDDQLIISLTIAGNDEIGEKYFSQLKEILQSNIGIISYIDPVEYENGKDFISKYSGSHL
ncbi:hypothetical protein C1637_17665 [Chryseobacterium lactis]|uniref:Uncharacterized protein n=1 Tax=Chryseobacterium lactis TaxID=1241981 RepID=A0A3G6RPB6_CHRLC|nr:hypothetical protein [Chryseobacterium lactis]AZA82938.1 hypothetical protein EG342_14085 [Chryseobacterium lactis]AZB03320.1 hypothetical protein EG341_04950 [Chryseobacterium lactis]PNW12394.1 hypothetical protein C1637_17665 [Chryseobacterium lactis]